MAEQTFSWRGRYNPPLRSHDSPVGSLAQRIYSRAYEATESALKKADEIGSDTRYSDDYKQKERRKILLDALKTVTKIRGDLPAGRDQLQTRRKEIRPARRREPGDMAGQLYDREIRDHLKRLPDSDRSDLVRRMIREGHEETVQAVLSAPAWLSGLSDELYGLIEATATRNLRTDDLASVEAQEKALEAAEKCADNAFALLCDAGGFIPEAVEREIAKQDDAADEGGAGA